MLCAISGEPPQEPVVSKRSGNVFEKRLIEKYIADNGKDPVTGEELDLEDLIPVKTARVVRPRPPTLTSIPALLSTFQNEWDALSLETFNLKEQLSRTREELATALYQHDAAVRVIARLTRERDEARDALSRVTVTAGSATNGDSMVVDSQTLSEELSEMVDEIHQKLSKSRKKRPVPKQWAKPDDIASFGTTAQTPLPVPQASSIGIDPESDYAAISGLKGDIAIYSTTADRLERSLQAGENVTDTLWTDRKVIVSTTKGSVKVLENGAEKASFSEHAGAATGLAVHPSNKLIASVGLDKSFIFYDLEELQPAARIYTDSSLTTCTFHPDGHLFATGTTTGDIKLFMTKTGEEAASFSLGAPIQALAFSENGFWLAATAKGQTTVTIFDLRKEGEAAAVKVLDAGGAVNTLAWDYSAQFLATGGPAGVTVQQYLKGSKAWSEPLRSAVPAVAVRWGKEAKILVAVNADGVVTVLGQKEE